MPDQTLPPPSWVPDASTSDGFGLNHLPYGVVDDGDGQRLNTRIGNFAFDLHIAADSGIFDGLPRDIIAAAKAPNLNALLELGPTAWAILRARLQQILGKTASEEQRERAERCLRPVASARMVLPFAIGDYTDFYASIHHARRVGELFRPDAPLLPNYKHLPIAYHGRASSIVVSGTLIRRPWGQSRPLAPEELPQFAPSAALDFEVELGFVVGTGNRLGEPIGIQGAEQHLFGVVLLNDWSARDLQSWEYQPLGPFLGKNFATSIAAWVTPLAALEPFRAPLEARAPDDPEPLEYLGGSAARMTFDISVSAHLVTSDQAQPRLGEVSACELYWSPAQMIAHHTINGCNLRPGDLLATGTISGLDPASAGCLLERTANGQKPIPLSDGSKRSWLMDGDEVCLEAACSKTGEAPVRLATCAGRVEAAPARR